MTDENEVVCQLTKQQVNLLLVWYYGYSFPKSEGTNNLAKFLGDCIQEYDVVDED